MRTSARDRDELNRLLQRVVQPAQCGQVRVAPFVFILDELVLDGPEVPRPTGIRPSDPFIIDRDRMYNAGRMRMRVLSLHRDTGDLVDVCRSKIIDRFDRRPIEHRVRDELRQAVLHEVDEVILVDGCRVFDPHRGEP